MSQNYKCFICNKKLLNFNNLIFQDFNSIQFIKKITSIENFVAYNSDNPFFVKSFNRLTRIPSEDIYSFTGNKWIKDFEIDRCIPRALSLYSILGFYTFLYKLLNSKENLFLAHKQCYKKKIINDIVILKLFKAFFQDELKKHNLIEKSASKILLQQCCFKAIIILNDYLLVKNKYQFVFNSNIFKKVVNIAIESLLEIDLANLTVYNKHNLKKIKVNNKTNYLKIYKHRMINKKKLLVCRSRQINYGFIKKRKK